MYVYVPRSWPAYIPERGLRTHTLEMRTLEMCHPGDVHPGDARPGVGAHMHTRVQDEIEKNFTKSAFLPSDFAKYVRNARWNLLRRGASFFWRIQNA